MGRCLSAIFRQNTANPFEVVVIDSGSTDSTLAILQQYPLKLSRISPSEFNFGSTRDAAFRMAQGEYLVTLSQDVEPATPDWLQSLTAPFADPDVAAVQGVCITPTSGPAGVPLPRVFFWVRGGYNPPETKRWRKLYGGISFSHANAAVRKKVWEEHPIGPVPMSEDKVLQKKLMGGGHRIVMAPQARAYHWHYYEDTLAVVRRCRNEGLGWRYVGVEYTVADLLREVLDPYRYAVLAYGLLSRKITTLQELLFPFIRPFCLYIGNHYATEYQE